MNRLSSDPIDILVASDAWGTRMILRVCAGLTRAQFHQRFAIGPGSLHDTLTHIISVMRRWTDRIAARTPRPNLYVVPGFPEISGEARDRTPVELLELLDEAERDLRAVVGEVRAASGVGEGAGVAGRLGLGSTLSVDWPGSEPGVMKTYTFTRGAVIVHLTTHGYHHRAQCLNMLRQLGATVPGVTAGTCEPSAVDWQAETESPAVVRGRA
ncbi:MAG: DinB family protein [Phycisphaerae bacterium]|nr:DinB family protein [Phycisphaerae bacterium]